MSDKKIKRIKGVVISEAMDKTIVANVSRVITHPLYHKKYAVTKKYKAHCEENNYKIGDVVELAPCKPISKDKHYIVIKKIS